MLIYKLQLVKLCFWFFMFNFGLYLSFCCVFLCKWARFWCQSPSCDNKLTITKITWYNFISFFKLYINYKTLQHLHFLNWNIYYKGKKNYLQVFFHPQACLVKKNVLNVEKSPKVGFEFLNTIKIHPQSKSTRSKSIRYFFIVTLF